MKKLLVLLVVLGIVSVANAGIIDVTITSLNGVAISNTKEITLLNASDTVDFRIMFNGPSTEYLFGIDSFFDITGPATLDWSHFVLATNTWDPDGEVWYWKNTDLTTAYDRLLHVVGQEGGKTFIGDGAADKGSVGTGAEVWIVRNVYLHCEGPGDVTVKLSNHSTGSIVIDGSYVRVP